MATKILDKLIRFPLWQKLTVLGFLGGTIIVFFHFTRWAPLNDKVTQLEQKLQDQDRHYKQQTAVAENLAEFKRKTLQLEEDLRLAITQLPKQKEISSLLRDIYTEGQKSGIDFIKFQPQAEQKKSLYAEVPIKLEIVGDYHEIGVFLDRIGKLSRIINVSNIELLSQKSHDGDNLLKVNCTLTTFMFLGAS